jgi:hypothetical protein
MASEDDVSVRNVSNDATGTIASNDVDIALKDVMVCMYGIYRTMLL